MLLAVTALLAAVAVATVPSGAGATTPHTGALTGLTETWSTGPLPDAGQPIALTVKEFDLLVHLARHPRQAFRREELLETIWGFSYGDTSTVTVHVRRLREKIERDPSKPRHVRTIWGVGYRFEP